ncbi:MAG: tetratricopeptide repeat protein [Vicinamibacteria bacterium]
MRKKRLEYDEACAAWMRAIELWLGHDDGAIASLRENIAEVHLLSGHHGAALQQYREAAAAYNRARQASMPALASDNLKWREGFCLVKVGRIADARSLWLEILQGPNRATFESEISLMERTCALDPT